MTMILFALAGIALLAFLLTPGYGPAGSSDVVDRDVQRARAEIAAIAGRADHR
ncbi:hypothetical protein IU449_22155 [Nocardia higoensis]|uniref:C-type cytochrome biogenesis protein CcmI n=1 Tax=Nocardia higoensis TaxID=228599 RepID=A0ABS0DFL4_9NOCA|nr:hypothetical protein [Nocardia higoensis]MBF6357214.1 hypothetical protein [Nocardia higoensis]